MKPTVFTYDLCPFLSEKERELVIKYFTVNRHIEFEFHMFSGYTANKQIAQIQFNLVKGSKANALLIIETVIYTIKFVSRVT